MRIDPHRSCHTDAGTRKLKAARALQQHRIRQRDRAVLRIGRIDNHTIDERGKTPAITERAERDEAIARSIALHGQFKIHQRGRGTERSVAQIDAPAVGQQRKRRAKLDRSGERHVAGGRDRRRRSSRAQHAIGRRALRRDRQTRQRLARGIHRAETHIAADAARRGSIEHEIRRAGTRQRHKRDITQIDLARIALADHRGAHRRIARHAENAAALHKEAIAACRSIQVNRGVP